MLGTRSTGTEVGEFTPPANKGTSKTHYRTDEVEPHCPIGWWPWGTADGEDHHFAVYTLELDCLEPAIPCPCMWDDYPCWVEGLVSATLSEDGIKVRSS